MSAAIEIVTFESLDRLATAGKQIDPEVAMPVLRERLLESEAYFQTDVGVQAFRTLRALNLPPDQVLAFVDEVIREALPDPRSPADEVYPWIFRERLGFIDYTLGSLGLPGLDTSEVLSSENRMKLANLANDMANKARSLELNHDAANYWLVQARNTDRMLRDYFTQAEVPTLPQLPR